MNAVFRRNLRRLFPAKPILAQIAQKDKLLSYPYESIRPFLEC